VAARALVAVVKRTGANGTTIRRAARIRAIARASGSVRAAARVADLVAAATLAPKVARAIQVVMLSRRHLVAAPPRCWPWSLRTHDLSNRNQRERLRGRLFVSKLRFRLKPMQPVSSRRPGRFSGRPWGSGVPSCWVAWLPDQIVTNGRLESLPHLRTIA